MKTLNFKSSLSLFLIFCVLSFVFRMAMFHIEFFDVDESQFAIYAQELLHGGKPFLSSVDTKPIGIYLYYALCFTVLGSKMISVHIVTTLVLALSATILCKLATRLSDNFLFSLTSGLLLIFYSSFLSPKILATSINMILMLPILLSTLFYWKWVENKKRTHFILSSCFAGLALLFKYQAGILLPLMCLHILWATDSPKKIRLCFIYILLALTPTALIGLYYFQNEVGPEFLFYTIWGNTAYISKGMSVRSFFKRLVSQLEAISFNIIPMILGGLVFLFLPSKLNIKQKSFFHFLVFCFLFHFLSICVGGRFYSHYYLQPLPFFILITSFGLFLLYENLQKYSQKLILIFVVLLSFSAPVYGHVSHWMLKREQFLKSRNDNYPDLYKKIGLIVKNKTKDDDRIFVWGNATPIYYFSERRPSSRFLWCDWLTGTVASNIPRTQNQILAEKVAVHSWEKWIEDFNANPPAYFLDTSYGHYHHYKKFPATKYKVLNELLKNHYTEEETIDGVKFYRLNATY